MHNKLNTNIWDDDKLKPIVRDTLLKLAARILSDIDIPRSLVKDIIFTGSLAGYNYTNHSDLDLHIIIDFDGIDIEDKYVQQFWDNIKTIWNDRHEVLVAGFEVEIYFQDVNADLIASAVYSVISDKWLRRPKHFAQAAGISDYKYKRYKELIGYIENAEPTLDNLILIDRLKDKIHNYRLTGLARAGEGSIENLTYKKLRSDGLIDKLYEIGDTLYDQYYSVDRK